MAVAGAEIERWGRAEVRASRVVITDPANPFCGLNYWKARAINDVFCGRRVYVGGGIHTPEPMEYIFLELALPGDRGFSGLPLLAYDLRLWSGPGSTRVISATLVRTFITVEGPELCPCARCGEWRPQSELIDAARWRDGELDDTGCPTFAASELVCRGSECGEGWW